MGTAHHLRQVRRISWLLSRERSGFPSENDPLTWRRPPTNSALSPPLPSAKSAAEAYVRRATRCCTHAADRLTDSFDQRTEGVGALKCCFKQVFVADAGTWEKNLNSPVGHSDGGEAGGAAERMAERPAINKGGRALTHRDKINRARAGKRRAVPPPHFERRY